MRNYYIIILILFFSCKNNATENKAEISLCQIFEQLDQKDQKYRNLLDDPFFKILDSIKESEGITMQMHIDMPKDLQLNLGNRARKIANKYKREFTQEEEDSIWDLQIQLDNENTEVFLNIIDSLGKFPTRQNTKCDNVPGYILAHSRPQYHNIIKEILNKGVKDSIESYSLIDYHINGREDTTILINQ